MDFKREGGSQLDCWKWLHLVITNPKGASEPHPHLELWTSTAHTLSRGSPNCARATPSADCHTSPIHRQASAGRNGQPLSSSQWRECSDRTCWNLRARTGTPQVGISAMARNAACSEKPHAKILATLTQWCQKCACHPVCGAFILGPERHVSASPDATKQWSGPSIGETGHHDQYLRLDQQRHRWTVGYSRSRVCPVGFRVLLGARYKTKSPRMPALRRSISRHASALLLLRT
jgi:hypothetical protein